MSRYVVSDAGTYHKVARINWKRGRAVSRCGRIGEPIEADPDPEERCKRCEPELRDDESDESDEEDR